MAGAPTAEFHSGEKPTADPQYLVDPSSGVPLGSTTNPLNVTGGGGGVQYVDGVATPAHPTGTELVFNNAGTMTAVSNSSGLPISGTVTATNPSVGTDGSTIPASSTLLGASDGTNLQQLLVESASNRNLRVGLYNGANEAAVDSSGRQLVNVGQINGQAPTLDNTTVLATSMRVKTTVAGDTALTLGQATMANSLPVTIASNQGALGSAVIQVVAGTALAADQTNSELRVSTYVKTTTAGDTALTLGSATSANSLPVVVASDQGAVQVKRSTVAVYSLASTTTSGSTQNSGDLTVGPYTEISIDINTTAQAGTSPTIQYFYERKAADGIYYVLWQSAVLTAASNTISTSIGAGMAYNQSLGVTGRIRWVVGGSATPTYTHTISIQGK